MMNCLENRYNSNGIKNRLFSCDHRSSVVTTESGHRAEIAFSPLFKRSPCHDDSVLKVFRVQPLGIAWMSVTSLCATQTDVSSSFADCRWTAAANRAAMIAHVNSEFVNSKCLMTKSSCSSKTLQVAHEPCRAL